MKTLNREHFLKAVVETRHLEKRLLSRGSFERMLLADDFMQIRAILIGAGYRHVALGEDIDVDETRFHALLNEFMADFLDEILLISPAGSTTEYMDLLFLSYDLHNIQAALMRREQGQRYTNRPVSLPRERSERYQKLLEDKKSDADDPYARLFYGARERFAESPRAAQEWLDRQYYSRLIAVAEETGVELFMEYAQAKVDFYNVLTMLRMSRMHNFFPEITKADAVGLYLELVAEGGTIERGFLEGAFFLSPEDATRRLDQTKYRRTLTEGVDYYSYDRDTSMLEKNMDDYLTRLVRDRKYTAMGPEPLFGYLHARSMELINLHLVFATRVQGLPMVKARERLREEYV